MDLNEIKKHWESWSKEFGIDLRATTKTPTIKWLEINAIFRAIQKTGLANIEDAQVLEVGCGNGYNCFSLSELLPALHFTGLDYVPEMIEAARQIQKVDPKKTYRITFQTGNLLDLESDRTLKGGYDVVFTDRCIINVNTKELQLKAFDQLTKKIKEAGYLIIVENIVENFSRQNDLREAVGLTRRNAAHYNLFIDEEIFLTHAKKSMELIATDDFGSLHDIILYVLTPMINNGEIAYDHPLVKAAAELGGAVSGKYENAFGNFGQNRLFLFKKKRRSG